MAIGVAILLVVTTLVLVDSAATRGARVEAALPAQVFVGGAVGEMLSLNAVRAGGAPSAQVFSPRCSTFALPVGVNVAATRVVYASTSDCNTQIALLNARTGSFVGNFSTAAVNVVALAMDPADANLAYILEFQPNSDFARLDRLNLSLLSDTAWVTQLPLPPGASANQLSTLAISPDGNTVYIGGSISTASASQSAIIYAVPVGGGPNPPTTAIAEWLPAAATPTTGVIDLAVDPSGGSLFATIAAPGATGAPGAFLYGIPTPLPTGGTMAGFPRALPAGGTASSSVEAPLTVDPAGQDVYVASSPTPGAASELQSYSTANGQPAVAPVSTGITTDSTGRLGIEGIAVSPDGSQLVAFGYNDNPNGPPGAVVYDVHLAGFTDPAATHLPNNGSFVTGPDNVAITPAQFSPTVSFSGSVAQTGQPTTFTATTPPGALPGMTFSYSWNFGDGNTGSGQSVSDIYTTAGSKNVRLTVTPISPSGQAWDTPGQTPYWASTPAQSTKAFLIHSTPPTSPSTPTTGSTSTTTPGSPTTAPGHKAGGPTLTLNPAVGPPGTIVTVTGSGFPKNTPLTVSWSVSSGSIVVTTDSHGNLPASPLYILTPDILGQRYAVASSTPSVRAPFLVVPSTSEPGGDSGVYLFRSEGP
jgi:hypothetical protein